MSKTHTLMSGASLSCSRKIGVITYEPHLPHIHRVSFMGHNISYTCIIMVLTLISAILRSSLRFTLLILYNKMLLLRPYYWNLEEHKVKLLQNSILPIVRIQRLQRIQHILQHTSYPLPEPFALNCKRNPQLCPITQLYASAIPNRRQTPIYLVNPGIASPERYHCPPGRPGTLAT